MYVRVCRRSARHDAVAGGAGGGAGALQRGAGALLAAAPALRPARQRRAGRARRHPASLQRAPAHACARARRPDLLISLRAAQHIMRIRLRSNFTWTRDISTVDIYGPLYLVCGRRGGVPKAVLR